MRQKQQQQQQNLHKENTQTHIEIITVFPNSNLKKRIVHTHICTQFEQIR